MCKFKFTGGARPSLEEKKTLSVDAGGNFRYFTGDIPRPVKPTSGHHHPVSAATVTDRFTAMTHVQPSAIARKAPSSTPSVSYGSLPEAAAAAAAAAIAAARATL